MRFHTCPQHGREKCLNEMEDFHKCTKKGVEHYMKSWTQEEKRKK